MKEVQSFKVRMPQLITVFIPMIVSGAVLTPISAHSKGSVQTFLIVVGFLLSITGVLCAILIGFRSRNLSVEDSFLVIGNQRIDARNIRNIHIKRTMVQVFATKMRHRSSFVLQEKDLTIGTAVLRSFAADNSVKFEQS